MTSISCIVVDTETTGINARENRVIEIGAVRIEEGRITDSFETLINPGIPVPRRITRLTGITTGNLAGAPAPGDAWRQFQSFAGSAVRAAHNASFDSAFVRNELQRLGEFDAETPWLCTVRLSRRLLPGLPSRRLDAVARFLGIPVGTRHRALADAEITAQVLLHLAERAEQAGFEGERGLLAVQVKRYAATSAESAHVRHMRRSVVPHLPEGPGVYRLLDGSGRLLYVGKARSLKSRVGSYFTAVEAKIARSKELVSKTRQVEVDETPTEFEALLLEARMIRRLQPPYNKALKRSGRKSWLRLDSAARRLSLHRFAAEDGSAWVGPLSGGSAGSVIAHVVAALAGWDYEQKRGNAPRDLERAAHAKAARSRLREVAAADDSLLADASGVMDADRVESLLRVASGPIRAAMIRASVQMAYEEAAVLHRWQELVAGYLVTVGMLSLLPRSGRAAVVCDVSGTREVAFMEDGRLVGTMAGHPQREESDKGVAPVPGSRLDPDHWKGRGPADDAFGMAEPDEEWFMLGNWAARHGGRVVQAADGQSLVALARGLVERD